jgi:uncharacterized protein (TIGR00369 family)
MANVMDDPEYCRLIDHFRDVHEEMTSFNDILTHVNKSPDFDHVLLVFEARDEFLGNLTYRILHGGITASMLDTAGGYAVWMSVFKQIKGQSLEKQINRVSKIGSINLRVDYLQPGKGNQFIATASILRTGKSVAVTRMELRNEKQALIAFATGTYTVG